jgi:hypothetical protein
MERSELTSRFARLTTAHITDGDSPTCLAARTNGPELTFRDHLKAVGGAIEV